MKKTEFNIYCDESCHLEHDGINIMGLGSIWCKKSDLSKITTDIKNIKIKYGLKPMAEIKWTMISKINYQLYLEILNYFFNNKALHYRGYFVDKRRLNHKKFHQTHEDFYYKSYFGLLQNIFDRKYSYNVYIDIKDHHSFNKAQKLESICRNSKHDQANEIINKIQPIQSHESQLIQIADIITGAICYYNRVDRDKLNSQYKKAVIDLIKEKTGLSLCKKTYSSEKKFNLFFLGDYDFDE